MKTKQIGRSVLFIIILAACSAHVFAQTEQQKLTATILHLDSAFWKAYNNCDTANFKDFITDDVEFYHDKGGVTLDAKSLIEALNKNICGNANSRIMTVIRENKVLVLKGGNNSYTLYPQSATSFFSKERDLVFEFVKDATGKPLKMIVKEHGAMADELVFEK